MDCQSSGMGEDVQCGHEQQASIMGKRKEKKNQDKGERGEELCMCVLCACSKRCQSRLRAICILFICLTAVVKSVVRKNFGTASKAGQRRIKKSHVSRNACARASNVSIEQKHIIILQAFSSS